MEIKISSVLYFTILAIFILLGTMAFYVDIAEDFNTELDPYIEDTFVEYEQRITSEKSKAENLQDDTLKVDPDADAFDIEGSFIIKSWKTARNSIGSVNQLIKLTFDLINNVANKLRIPGWLLSLIMLTLFVTLLIVALRIGIERRGT